MQWGDVSYVSDTLDNFMSSTRGGNQFLNLRRGLPRSYFESKSNNIDSRYMKVKILA